MPSSKCDPQNSLLAGWDSIISGDLRNQERLNKKATQEKKYLSQGTRDFIKAVTGAETGFNLSLSLLKIPFNVGTKHLSYSSLQEFLISPEGTVTAFLLWVIMPVWAS